MKSILLIYYFLVLAYSSDNGNVIVGYYTDWTSGIVAPEQIPFKKITHINYAFAIPTENQDISLGSGELLRRISQSAHQNNVKVLLSVGGWSGSKYFSSIVKNAENRSKFIDKMKFFINQYNLDGIDIDWEYPGRQGIFCNQVDLNLDTPNFILLLKEMRAQFDVKLITLAVRSDPFEVNKMSVNDLSELAKWIDFINIMAYDINTDWNSTSAPNAPFEHEPGVGVQNSFVQSIEAWTNAKIPADKIVMGVPFYGKAKKLTRTMNDKSIYQPIEQGIPKGDNEDGLWADPCPGTMQTFSGVWKWRNLKTQSVLTKTNEAGPGWTKYWDAKSQTPFLYNGQSLTIISYDDPESLKIKRNYVNTKGLKGIMFWSLDLDNGELLDAIQN